MNKVSVIAWWLIIIGALNWGLVGVFGLDLVALLFGPLTVLSRIVYILVGASGVWALVEHFKGSAK